MTFRVPASLRLTVPLILLGFAATLSTVNFFYHVPRAERIAEENVGKRLAQAMSRLQSTLDYLPKFDPREASKAIGERRARTIVDSDDGTVLG